MQAARQRIRALIEETRDMKGTEDEMEIVMNHLDALEDTAAGVRVSQHSIRYFRFHLSKGHTS